MHRHFGLGPQRRLLAAEIFGKMKVTEVLYSVTFIADMGLTMLFLTRHCYFKRKLVDFQFFLLSSSCWR